MVNLSNDSQSYKWVRILFRCAAIVLGIAETWATRHAMGTDGVAYLDMGDAYLRGDWHMALNRYWSPLYSCLLGAAVKVLKPSPYWEFPVVHLVNLAVFLAALVSFEFLLSGLIAYQKRMNQDREDGLAAVPGWAWYAIGYTLFLWTSFNLIGLGTVTPDLCVAAFAYLASGLILRIRAGSAPLRTFALLGIVLGLGYLARAIFFPLAFVFLGVALFSADDLRKTLPRVLMAAFIFIAIAAPLFIALSMAIGRPTFSETGRYQYLQFVDRPDYVKLLATHILEHPTHRIYESPAAFEFARPDKSTFPLWYDPAYWWEGYRLHFDLKGQIRALTSSAINDYNYFFLSEAGVVAGVIVLFFATPWPWLALKGVGKNWHLIIPAVAATGAFSLLHVEGRFVGPFVVLLWLGILSAVRLPNDKGARKLIAGVVLAIMITTGVPVLSSTFFDVAAARHRAPVDWEVAQALNHLGLQPGDKVAMIRHETPSSPWMDFYWARLARIRIIAEIPPEEVDKYWAASPAVQADVLNAFDKVGAKAVITPDLPPCASTATWRKLGDTNFYAYLFPLPSPRP